MNARLATYLALCIVLTSNYLGVEAVAAREGDGSSSSAQAHKLAAQVREMSRTNAEAAYAIFFTMLADKVVLHHVPATPTEGPVDGSYISNGARREDSAAHRAMPDFKVELKEIVATGDEVKVLRIWRGTGIDGQPIFVTTRVEFELHDGKIIAITATWDGDPRQRQRLEATLKQRGGAES